MRLAAQTAADQLERMVVVDECRISRNTVAGLGPARNRSSNLAGYAHSAISIRRFWAVLENAIRAMTSYSYLV